MNVVFILVCTASLGALLFTSPTDALGSMLKGAEGAISLALRLLAVYAVWLGVLNVMRQSGVSKGCAKLFSPAVKRLFKGEKPETMQVISENLAANFLGMGGAATPLGIKAMKMMQRGDAVTDNMVTFVVINACGVGLIPTTVIALRQSAGSASPADILLPTLLSTVITAAIGVTLAKIFTKPLWHKR